VSIFRADVRCAHLLESVGRFLDMDNG
jgi:hypothetical protein